MFLETIHNTAKSHNSGFNNYLVMPNFEIRNLYKKFSLAYNSKNIQHFQMKLGTHVPRNNTHNCTKLCISGFNNYSVMPHNYSFMST